MRTSLQRVFLLVLVLVAPLASLGGCIGHVHAWDKGQLAHPTMTTAEVSLGLDGHVRAVSEGAVGGLAGAGGGCGCN